MLTKNSLGRGWPPRRKVKRKDASIDGRGVLYSSEILDKDKEKVTPSFPFSGLTGHPTAKQLINVVALLWSQESLMGSFLPHKIKI